MDSWCRLLDVCPESDPLPVLLCLSHLRWDFVFQRPQHLLSRAMRTHQVIFFEEPRFEGAVEPHLHTRRSAEGVLVATPVLPKGLDPISIDGHQQRMLAALVQDLSAPVDVLWFYTPMALEFAGSIAARVVVYDCMDELTLFDGASPRLKLLERRLLKRSDLVFCGGRSLHAAKHGLHAAAHLFPSSVDVPHFKQARGRATQAADQMGIAGPRIGYFGVVDERLDYALLAGLADARPDWQFVMVGPTAKIDPAGLPRRANLHWLGGRPYSALPEYLAGWNAGMMPFALNGATRFISPTKTPEFLAAGVPLVSTAIADVVADWSGVVEIAAGTQAFAAALGRVMARPRAEWLAQVDKSLSALSWDKTWSDMLGLIGRESPGVGGLAAAARPARPAHAG